jgi:hypothetical protein
VGAEGDKGLGVGRLAAFLLRVATSSFGPEMQLVAFMKTTGSLGIAMPASAACSV